MLRRIAALHELSAPEVKNLTFGIDEDKDGWTVTFSGDITGAMHPKSFCKMVIEELNAINRGKR